MSSGSRKWGKERLHLLNLWPSCHRSQTLYTFRTDLCLNLSLKSVLNVEFNHLAFDLSLSDFNNC